MMAAGISWVGMDALQLRLFEAHLNAMKALGGALYLEGQTIMTRSKKIVPVDDAYLKNSGHVAGPEYSAHVATVTLGYGGAAAAYALVQHENEAFHHPSLARQAKGETRGQGEAKYLQRPVLEAQAGLHNRLARRIKRRIL